MKDTNLVFIVGRVGNQPELRYTAEGKAVCRFNLATHYHGFDKSMKKAKKQTEWHRILIFGELAEKSAQSLKLGAHTAIKGRNHTRKYNDKQGIERFITEIVTHTVLFEEHDVKKLDLKLSQLEEVE